MEFYETYNTSTIVVAKGFAVNQHKVYPKFMDFNYTCMLQLSFINSNDQELSVL